MVAWPNRIHKHLIALANTGGKVQSARILQFGHV